MWKRALRISAFVLGFLLLLLAFNECSKTINTLNALRVIESDRDQWQRPADVIAAMNVKRGDVVADLGSGAGYFSLKLASAVTRSGKVLAVDIDQLQLRFVWLRALLAGCRNVHIRLSGRDDPGLPVGRVDAVLVANTYHELAHPDPVFDRVYDALRPAGRVVLIDRSTPGTDLNDVLRDHHEASPDTVAAELSRHGFGILIRQDDFIDRPNGERWWMMVAIKPVR
jgi:predicted methyltransferase